MTRGIDILFATHNGARTLPRVFAAMEKLKAPKRPWRIIAVDNASADGAASILRDASARLPMEVVYQSVPGKRPSLQLGATRLLGDFVLFTDDDVEVSPDWLVAYEEAIEANPAASIFGGTITPQPMEEISPWFDASADHHAVLFAKSCCDDGEVDAVACIYGPNFMLKRELVDVLHIIPEALGPTFERKHRNVFPMGEDTAIMEALVRDGAKAIYVKKASVCHLVRAYQTELQEMLSRAERHGRGFSIRLFDNADERPNRMRWIAANLVRYANAKMTEPSRDVATPEVFNKLWELHWLLGAAKGAMNSGKTAPVCVNYSQRNAGTVA